MKILVVEDEPSVSSLIQKALAEEGYDVTIAMDGNMAWDHISRFTYSLFVFDLMLPGINGIELCKKARQGNIETPILILTALGATDNVVAGLDSGADDYLAKPFKIAELLARVRSLMRRSKVSVLYEEKIVEKNELGYADVVMDMNEKKVTRDGAVIDLTVTEFRLLEYFLRNPKKVLSRMDILEKVWGYDFNTNTKVVDVYMNYLRKKLETNDQSKLLHTVVGMGYMLKEEQ